VKSKLAFSAALALSVGAAWTAEALQPPAPPAMAVTETLYGQTVVDPYRYMEALGPETLDWMKAQGRYTRGVFDSMPGRAELGRDLAAFTASIVPVTSYQSYGGRSFYLERASSPMAGS
jgi:prolyl oligopeptidase